MPNKILKIRIKTHGVPHVASSRRHKAISCSALLEYPRGKAAKLDGNFVYSTIEHV
jgi:hypothetical protein